MVKRDEEVIKLMYEKEERKKTEDITTRDKELTITDMQINNAGLVENMDIQFTGALMSTNIKLIISMSDDIKFIF